MADEPAKPHLLVVAEHLQRHGVEFMVIGGQAATLLGSPLPRQLHHLMGGYDGKRIQR